MFRSARKRHHRIDIWPGFVDAMATLLMVIIFVLMTFVLAQFYLTDAISNKDLNLARMSAEISSLTEALKKTTAEKEATLADIAQLQQRLQLLTGELNGAQQSIEKVKNDLTSTTQEKTAAEAKISSLDQQIAALETEIKRFADLLSAAEAKILAKDNQILEKDSQILEKNGQISGYEEKQIAQSAEISQLNAKLNEIVIAKTDEVNEVIQKLQGLQQSYDFLNQEYLNLQKENLKFKGNLVAYRSEFFALLQKTVGNRSDTRVVGDRFVFQSEVLFNTGSAELGTEGKRQLAILVKALKEISEKIPRTINWILRVDGHTDQVPINTDQFPSNWELSSARAISVVRYLVSQGIASRNLVAAGFGEFQPLEESTDPKAQARNRRIEFKLDQR